MNISPSTIGLIGETIVEFFKLAESFIKIQQINLADKADVDALWLAISNGDTTAVAAWSTAFHARKAVEALAGTAFIPRTVTVNPISKVTYLDHATDPSTNTAPKTAIG